MGDEVGRRSVDWEVLVGSDVDVAILSPGPAAGLLSSVLSATEELSAYQDGDTVVRRAVELARDRLGIERVAIFLEEPATGQMVGTWGTGLSGETTDEHHLTYRQGQVDREVHEKARSGIARWLVLSDAPLLAQEGGEPTIVGRSWVAATAIRSSARSIGTMFNDTAISRRPLSEAQQTRLAVYCSLLGGLLERHMSFPQSGSGGQDASQLSQGNQPLVRRVVRALRDNPSLEGKALAAQMNVTEGHLNRQFRKMIGVSIVDYRNRLRIERFLQSVENGQSNLHEAAESAGFGSYAQFHRVFRATLGASPREYLTGQRETGEGE